MADKFRWYGDSLLTEAEREIVRRLSAAGSEYKDEVKVVLSESGKSITVKTSKTGRQRKVYGKKNSSPSQPGEPPHKQTGRLRRSVAKRVLWKKMRVRILCRDPKAQLLEFGTSKVAARPFLRPTFNRMLGRFREIVGKRLGTSLWS